MKFITADKRITFFFFSCMLVFLLVLNFLPVIVSAEDTVRFISPYRIQFTDNNGNDYIMAISPLKPPELKMRTAAESSEIHVFGVPDFLSDVPAYYWSYGCSATSAAMLFGYYDRIGYENIYTGPTNGGIMPLTNSNSIWGSGECPLSATHYGIDGRTIRGHVDDYWLSYGSNGPDPWVADNVSEHTTGDCTADYMGTNQWKYHGLWGDFNQDGGTLFFFDPNGDQTTDSMLTGIENDYHYRDGCHGMKLFAESRGYTVVTNYNQYIEGHSGTESGKGFSFEDFQQEIDAGCPVLIHVDGHTMLGYGYNVSDNTVVLHDTWDFSDHTMEWGGAYSYGAEQLQHYAVSVIKIKASTPTVTNANGADNVTDTEATLNGNVTATGGQYPEVHLCWGMTDNGTTAENWDHDEYLGMLAAGKFSKHIVGLIPGETYFYRCYVVNSGGTGWSSSASSFVANALPMMEPIIESEGVYYINAPVFSNFGFDDNDSLQDGWYQIDMFSGTWTELFTNCASPSWDNDNWTIPVFDDLAQGPHTIYFKASDNAGNIEGESGEWKWQFLKDTVAPAEPSGLTSSSHFVNTWSSNSTATVSWLPSSDTTSGLDGYSYIWDTSAATTPDTTKDIEEMISMLTYTGLSDGNPHYFHIRAVDTAGNWSLASHLGPLLIDTIAPTEISNLTSSVPISTWSVIDTIEVNWTAAVDETSGVAGYSYIWDTSASTVPDVINDIDESNTTLITSDLIDSQNLFFHIRATDKVGNGGTTSHLGPFQVDSTVPGGPMNLTSSSHDINAWSSDNTVTVSWLPAFDITSGIDGYSYSWDTITSTIPDSTKDIEEPVTIITSLELNDSSGYYFHIKARDNAGNWGTPQHLGPFHITVNSPVLSAGVVSPVSGYQNSKYTFSVNYRHPQGLPPAAINVVIDGTVSDNMTLAGQSDNYMENQEFIYEVPGSSLAVGTHTFSFTASDNASHAALGDIDSHSGPSISAPVSEGFGGFGGGGGGGGGVAPAGLGITNLSIYTNNDGLFNLASEAWSEDRKVSVRFGKGVLAQTKDETQLKFVKIVPVESPAPAPAGSRFIGEVYELTPEGAHFTPSVTMIMYYGAGGLPEGIGANSLVIVVYDAETKSWQPLESAVNQAETSVTTGIPHFSIYALTGKKAAPRETVKPVPAPARFSLSGLMVNPVSVLPGESVTVSTRISNTGESDGEYEVVLKVNGEVEKVKAVSIKTGSSETVSFDVSQASPGDYEVEINGNKVVYTVRAVKPAATSSEPDQEPGKKGLNWLLIGSLIVGGLAVGIGIVILINRRRK